MSDAAFEAYVVELKCRHDEGKIEDAQYWAGLLGVALNYARRDDVTAAVQHLGLLPEAFLLAIPGSALPRLQEAAVELAQRFRDAGVTSRSADTAAGLS